MITIHHLNNSRSQRVLWLLEELELPYEIRKYQRDPATMLAPPELLAVHPLGKAPVLTEDGMTVAETGAIVEYILARHSRGRLTPAQDGAAFWPFRHWMHHAEGSAMPPLVMTLILGSLAKRVPPAMQQAAQGMAGSLQKGFVDPNLEPGTVEELLEQRPRRHRLVRRARDHCCRYHDELSPGGCRIPLPFRARTTEPKCLSGTYPCPPGLSAGVGTGRGVCLCVRVAPARHSLPPIGTPAPLSGGRLRHLDDRNGRTAVQLRVGS